LELLKSEVTGDTIVEWFAEEEYTLGIREGVRDGGDKGAERIESLQEKRIVGGRSALKNPTCGGQNNCGR